jgi:hypothetical protein
MILVTGATGHVRRRRLQIGVTRPRCGRNGPGRPGRRQAVFREWDDVLTVNSGKLAFRLAKQISID